MARTLTFLLSLLALVLLAALPGCGKKQLARVSIQADGDINPDDRGGALPVVLRFYQLKNNGAFEAAAFAELWENEAAALGADLLERQEMTVFPNSRHSIEIVRNPLAGYLGVMALFRQPDGEAWRRTIRLVKKKQKVYVLLRGQRLEVSDREIR